MIRAFITGAAVYPALEVLFRGRTHPSMSLAGGLSMMLIHAVNRHMQVSLPVKALMCAAGITAVEAGCGLAFNKRHQVWDYRSMPLNWRGQVCLPFTGLWYMLSLAGLTLDKAARRA